MGSEFVKIDFDASPLEEYSCKLFGDSDCSWSASCFADNPDFVFLNLFVDRNIESCVRFLKDKNRIVKVSTPKSRQLHESSLAITGKLLQHKRELTKVIKEALAC